MKKTKKIHIDLKGPDGNAFCLLGTARDICENKGLSEEETDIIIGKMMSGDYTHLLITFRNNFRDDVKFI